MPLLLAIDQSTSATKALLFDADGRLLDRESREHAQHFPQPGWVEHDAEEILANTRTVLRLLLGRHSGRRHEIAGLALTNQRETVVVFERATGRPLFPAIVWQCRRSEALCRELAGTAAEAEVREKTGLKLDPYFSGSKLLWLVRHRPDLRARLESGEAVVGTIDTYLIHRLTLGAVFATDPTNASRTLLYDVRRLRWDEELARIWGVPTRALPEVRESSDRFGETDLDGLLPRPVPICGVMGDSQAALFAQGCFVPGATKVTFGTGSSLLLNIGSDFRRSHHGAVTALAWVRHRVPVYAFEGIIISAASTLTWLRDQLGLSLPAEDIESLATAVPDSGGVYLVPAFAGLGIPYWAPEARALISGLSAHSDRRHLIRAALEAIAFQLHDALAALRIEAPVAPVVLHCDGGPTGNRFLMQFTADVLGIPLQVSPLSDGSALGAARAGWVGLGELSFDAAFPQASLPRETYVPSEHLAHLPRLIAGWRHAVAQATLPVASVAGSSPLS